MQNHHCESCPQVPETRSDALGRAIPGPFAHISNTYQYEASLRVKWGGLGRGVVHRQTECLWLLQSFLSAKITKQSVYKSRGTSSILCSEKSKFGHPVFPHSVDFFQKRILAALGPA